MKKTQTTTTTTTQTVPCAEYWNCLALGSPGGASTACLNKRVKGARERKTRPIKQQHCSSRVREHNSAVIGLRVCVCAVCCRMDSILPALASRSQQHHHQANGFTLSLSFSLPPLMLMLLLRTYIASCYVYSSSSTTPRHLQSNNSTRHTAAKVSKNNNPILVYLPVPVSFNTPRHWTREQMIQWSEEWSLLLHQSRYETMRCGGGKRRRRRRIGRH